MGWRVLIVCECSTSNAEALECLPEVLRRWIDSDARIDEISAQTLVSFRKVCAEQTRKSNS